MNADSAQPRKASNVTDLSHFVGAVWGRDYKLAEEVGHFLLTQDSFPVENARAVRTACCSKTKRDLEQFCSRIDLTSKYCTKNLPISSDPVPVGKL